VVDAERKITGVITRKDIENVLERSHRVDATIGSVARLLPTVAYANEPLRVVAYRMAAKQFTRMPVVDPRTAISSWHDLAGGFIERPRAHAYRRADPRARAPPAVAGQQAN